MRILHVLDHSIPLHSGYSFRTRAILEQQRELGWETFHVTSPKHYGSADLEELVDGFRFFRTPRVNGFWSRTPVLNQLAVVDALTDRLTEVFEQVQPDILHAHSPALNGLAALRVGRRHGVPVVYEVRALWEDAAVDHGTSREWGARYRLTRGLETWVLRRADAVTTICGGLREELISRGIPPDKVTVIPNAVDATRFSVGRPRDEGLAAELQLRDRRVLGFIGSFYAYEGLSVLLDAVPRMLQALPDIGVVLVGGGPEEEKLRRRAVDLGVADRVVFTGRVPHEDVARYYDLIDVFVYPRLAMRLTELVTPLKPLEAMAQGKLVVASDVGGHRELIQEGSTGELFRAGDPQALADAVVKILEHPEEWAARRARARQFVEEERNWKVSVSNYQPVYQHVHQH